LRIPIRAVLFKRITEINWRALTGQERGQYDLRVGADPEFGTFFDLLPEEDRTDLGGWSRRVTFEPYTGPNPVPASHVTFRYMGPKSQRKDYYFASQKYDLPEAYQLWRPGRAAPVDSPFDQVDGSATIVVRDCDDRFHARWLSPDAVSRLPEALRVRIQEDGKGVDDMRDAVPAISPRAQEVLDALLEHHNVLVYGPPGTGKTFIVQEVLRSFRALTLDTDAEHDPIASGSSTHALWATFHQSYSYEDFIVGLRPRPLKGGGFTLMAVPGTLLELSEWARQPGNRSLLVIDEINRGNVSRIFGELITLLDVDKRLAPDGSETSTTVRVRLPYLTPDESVSVVLSDGNEVNVPNPFTLPEPLYMLATMNSVDTSVAPLDAALRRRFTMLQLTPDLAAMRTLLGLGDGDELPEPATGLPDRDDVCALALRTIRRLNQGIAMFLGSDFEFGHWYLEPLLHTSSRADALFPQLMEYFSGRTEQLVAVLRQPPSSPAAHIETPETDWEVLGASSVIGPSPAPGDNDVLDLLVHIAGSEPVKQQE
jgi:5-methylcytosine-specific restriction enzyme B